MQLRDARTGPALALLLPCLLAGCYIKVNKSKNGDDKDVEVRLPVGGVHVQQSAPSDAEMELPSYPGAVIIDDKHGKSANVDVGFGAWQIHIRVAKYETGDPQAKVTSFYRSALQQFGDVLECRSGHAVGSVSVTRQGLGCNDEHKGSKGIHIDDDDDEYSLRAGSKRHQHIVAIKPGSGNGTQFTLLRLDLPSDIEQDDKQE